MAYRLFRNPRQRSRASAFAYWCWQAGYAFRIGAATLLLTAGCASRVPRAENRASALPKLQLILHAPKSVPNLLESARIDCEFLNRGSIAFVLPVSSILLERNLFIRLFAADGQDPFQGRKCEDLQDTMPPFQVPAIGYVVLDPGQSYTMRLEGVPWQSFRRFDDEQPVNGSWRERGQWAVKACFSGTYPVALSSDIPASLHKMIWREPVVSQRVLIDVAGGTKPSSQKRR